jgi:ribosomal protein S18 acetylase RimI-like enzyme
MQILNSTADDFAAIFELYDAAIAHQKAVSAMHWQGFDVPMVRREIAENRQFKIMIEGQIACIFAVTYADPDIWDEKSKDAAIYLHRIVTNPAFRGRNFVQHIVTWAHEFGAQRELKYIRLDTWGNNTALYDHYIRCGFQFVGIKKVEQPNNLPSHYNGISLGLFEILII